MSCRRKQTCRSLYRQTGPPMFYGRHEYLPGVFPLPWDEKSEAAVLGRWFSQIKCWLCKHNTWSQVATPVKKARHRRSWLHPMSTKVETERPLEHTGQSFQPISKRQVQWKALFQTNKRQVEICWWKTPILTSTYMHTHASAPPTTYTQEKRNVKSRTNSNINIWITKASSHLKMTEKKSMSVAPSHYPWGDFSVLSLL